MIFSDFRNIKENHLTCIQDDAENSGTFLIKEFVTSNLSDDTKIHIFCYDRYCDELKTILGIDSKYVFYYDCLPALIHEEESRNYLEDFVSSLKLLKSSLEKIIIIIDSISTLLFEKNFKSVYRLLHELTSNSLVPNRTIVQTLIILHEDTLLHPANVIKQLKHLCKIWLLVRTKTVTMLTKKSSGKLYSQIYQYEINEDSKIVIKKTKNVVSNSVAKETEKQPLSTFKLTLNESEKKARNAVKLPYIKDHSEKDNSKGGGEIYYEPDEYDDWDEEDPDNDLEFT